MAKLTRRGLIKTASIGAGTAGVLAAASAGVHFIPTKADAASAAVQTSKLSNEPFVISVSNPSNGTLVVMQGEREVTVHNPGLVRSLLAL
jgi:uroporphyrinogen-III synthase